MYIKYINRVFPTGGMEGVPASQEFPCFLTPPSPQPGKIPPPH